MQFATRCAAAHSTNITCARPLNVLKFLGLRLLASGSFSIERRPTRYDLHVSILQELFVVHLLFLLSWNVSPGFGSKKLEWFGVRGEWPQHRLSCFV